jgi:hypothetical protein
MFKPMEEEITQVLENHSNTRLKATTVLTVTISPGRLIYGSFCQNMKRRSFIKNKQLK